MHFNKKYVLNILLIVAVTAIAMYFSLKDNFSQIIDAIGKMNPVIFLIVMCWGLLITAVCGVAYQILGKLYKKDFSLLDGIIVSYVGNFFAGITPSSTGGQFGQIYVLKKRGIGYSDGASLLWADFIIYQTTMMIYVSILFILRFTHYVNLSAWFWLIFAGYIINLIVIICLYTLAIFPNFYIKLAGWAAEFLRKIHLTKHPDQLREKWVSTVTGFTGQIKFLSRQKKVILQCALVNVIRLSMYFSLPYLISRGLGINLPVSDLIDTLALASFVTMANSFIPLPGASGGTEVVFTLLFKTMLGSLTGAVMLLWRFSSYYIPMIFGAVVFLLFKNRNDRQQELAQIEAEKEQAA